MAEKLFFGTADSVVPIANGSQLYHEVDPDTSAYTGILTSVTTRVLAAGQAQVQVYDLATNALIADTGDQAVVIGVNNLSVTPIAVTASASYGIGTAVDTAGAYGVYLSADGRYFKSGVTYATWVPPDPINLGIYGSDSIYRTTIGAYGWEPPTISGIDDSNIISGGTYTLTGTDFMPDTDPITVEICNNSNYAAATVKVTQTVTSQADTSIDFTAVTTGLSGACWIFATTNLGQINATGLSVTVGRIVYAWIERAEGTLSAQPHEVLLV